MDIKKRIIEEIKEYEWDDVDQVISTIIPNIIFTVNENASELRPLDSRFGGRPAVPKNFKWPKQSDSEKAPLAFFFQLNFEQIKLFDVESTLPDHGILLCFTSVFEDMMYGPQTKDDFKLYYFKDTNTLSLMDIPDSIPSERQLEPRAISYKTSYELPRYPFNYISDELSEDDADGIDDVADQMFIEAINITNRIEMARDTGLTPPSPEDDFYTIFSHNVLLGVPAPIQNPIAEEWSEAYSETYESVEPEDYVNLISFEMKNREGFGFSDDGSHLFLCMHKDDLKNKAFEKTICFIQNT